jgi:hypothetical protein
LIGLQTTSGSGSNPSSHSGTSSYSDSNSGSGSRHAGPLGVRRIVDGAQAVGGQGGGARELEQRGGRVVHVSW